MRIIKFQMNLSICFSSVKIPQNVPSMIKTLTESGRKKDGEHLSLCSTIRDFGFASMSLAIESLSLQIKVSRFRVAFGDVLGYSFPTLKVKLFTAGQPLKALELPLCRMAAISGRAQDLVGNEELVLDISKLICGDLGLRLELLPILGISTLFAQFALPPTTPHLLSLRQL